MSRPISFGVSIHAAPERAYVFDGASDGLNLDFTAGHYPHVTMHCGDRDLALDLAAAINAVLARHRDLAAEEAA